MTAGIILAAGESSRMGSDKALLPYGSTNFVTRLIDLFLPRVSPVIVVLGHNAETIQAAIPPRAGLRITVNADYRRGQFSSLQTGIRTLPSDAGAALVTLVDHPAVREATLDLLLDRFRPPLLVPRYQGRRGHPIVLGRALLNEILALPPAASAKQVVRAYLSEAAQIDVDDPGILRDIDTPADYEDLREGG